MFTISEIFDRIISIFIPMRCVLCGDAVEYDDLWCGKCELPRTNGIILQNDPCLDAAASPLFYTDNPRRAVLRLKDELDKRTAHFFAEMMHEYIRFKFEDDFDMLVPVPLSPSKLSERGFNQAELLAHELGGLIGKEVECGILSRNDSTSAQHKLNARERLKNARKSYSAQNPHLARGRKILLVDDVYTTGATINACALLLKGAGATGVSVVTATYTKPREFDREPPQ